MKDLFGTDPERFNKLNLEYEDSSILFDYSKNIITEETMSLLYALAEQQDVSGLAKKMYSGEKISKLILTNRRRKRNQKLFCVHAHARGVQNNSPSHHSLTQLFSLIVMQRTLPHTDITENIYN